MTSREEIERLLQMTGRTLEGLPELYSSPEAEAAITVAGDTRIQTGNMLLHQSDAIELLVGALRDAIAKVPKWISVKERLPEEHGIYLAHIVHRYCKIDSYSRVAVEYFSRDGKWDSLPDLYEVTHWMPLPEPPEEGE